MLTLENKRCSIYISDLRNTYNKRIYKEFKNLQFANIYIYEEGLIYYSLEPFLYSISRRYTQYIKQSIKSPGKAILEPNNYQEGKKFQSISLFDHVENENQPYFSKQQLNNIINPIKKQILSTKILFEEAENLFLCTNHVVHTSQQEYYNVLKMIDEKIPNLKIKFHPKLCIDQKILKNFRSIDTRLPIELFFSNMKKNSTIYSFNSSALLYAKLFGFKGSVKILTGPKIFYSQIVFSSFVKNLRSLYFDKYKEELEILNLFE